MLIRENFENLHAVIWIYVSYFSACGMISTQILFKFFDLNSECFAKYDVFCSHIFDYVLSNSFEIMEKLYT